MRARLAAVASACGTNLAIAIPMRFDTQHVPQQAGPQHDLVGQAQSTVATQQVVEGIEIGVRPRQVIASKGQELAKSARAQSFTAQRPADNALERERRVEQPLLVAADHALSDVVAELLQLPR